MRDAKSLVEQAIREGVPANGEPVFDVEQIREILPHRYPFLLVDKILEFEPGKRCVGLKNVTVNEKFFNGHFPGHAIMPGAILVESMAQVGCVLMLTMEPGNDRLAYFAAMDKVRFYKPVLPGDTVIIEVQATGYRRGVGKIKATARVGDKVVCEGELTCALVDRNRKMSPGSNGG